MYVFFMARCATRGKEKEERKGEKKGGREEENVVEMEAGAETKRSPGVI